MNEPSVIHLPDRSARTTSSPDEITFVGTATTLIRVAGFSILTDPNFLRRGDRAYVGLGLTTKRLTEPAIGQLPELDFIVLSHHHEDHFDRIATRDLDHDLPIVTEPHAARKLASQGFRSPLALTTWQSQTMTRAGDEVRVTSLPGQHAPRPLGYLVPLHHDDYTLFKSPLSDFRRAVADCRLPADIGIHYLNRGESYVLSEHQPRR